MQCSSCGFDNPEGMKFCGHCATSLSPRCPQCGFENPPGFAYCGQCATPLTPYSLTFALGWAAMCHTYLRQGHAAREQVETLMALSTEQGFPLLLGVHPAPAPRTRPARDLSWGHNPPR
jgi:hypothetical protein